MIPKRFSKRCKMDLFTMDKVKDQLDGYLFKHSEALNKKNKL